MVGVIKHNSSTSQRKYYMPINCSKNLKLFTYIIKNSNFFSNFFLITTTFFKIFLILRLIIYVKIKNKQ